MAPRSPTHAFDPTPALEYNRHNYSPFNESSRRISFSENVDKGMKEVRFSDTPMFPSGPRHSIATTGVPLLPGVISASRIPKQSFRITDPPPGIDINAYIENCRNLNEQLRSAHEAERKTWSIERSSLQARIADLEFRLNRARDPKRRSSNDSAHSSAASFRTDFRAIPNGPVTNGTTRTRSEPPVPSVPQVWRGPDTTPPVTRVFSNEEDVNHLPSISEDEPIAELSKEISPGTAAPVQRSESVSVPIEDVDSSLDGVTLRSAGLTSSFVKIISPSADSPAHSPRPKPKSEANGNLHVDMNTLVSPLDEKLKLNAGHTPMAFDGPLSTSGNSDGNPTPKVEHPPAPVPTTRPPLRPSENSDSYFSFTSETGAKGESTNEPEIDEQEPEAEPNFETKEDPVLKGPLMLDSTAATKAANAFLKKVDAKLMEAAQTNRRDSVLSGASEDAPATNGQPQEAETTVVTKEKDDEMPVLKLKQSTNFGSSWGGSMPGRRL